MQAKGLTALIAVTLAVTIAAIALSLRGGTTGSGAGSGEMVFAGLAEHLGDAAALKIARAGGTVTLQRHAAGDQTQWVVLEKGGYPADPAKIRQTLLGFAELKLVEPKTTKAESYKRLEVEDPGKDAHSRLVEIDDAKGGKMGEVIVGKRRPDRLGTGADGLYVRRPGDAQSWLAQGKVDLPSETKDWLDKRVAEIPAKRIRQVTLTHEDGSVLVLKREKPEDKFTVEGAPADAKLKSDAAIAEPAGVLDGLELNDVRPAAEMAFPEQGVSRAEWLTFDGLAITGETVKKDDANWLRLKAAGDDKSATEAAALNARWSPWTWSVYEYKASAMKTKLADLVEAPKGS
ncbi:MAG: DUF4340 domain-containing protein [Alphaproteobacteria bacterium]|nr:DUF4340 domain-containing protein [Alphaproteobacteria bacterium]